MSKIFSVLAMMLLLCVTLLSGCADLGNYQFGNMSKSYCASTDSVFRQGVKDLMKEQGVELGIDYCTAHGMMDAMNRVNSVNET